MTARLRAVARPVFVVALAAAFTGAVWPDPGSDQILGSDKVLHILAFSVLSFWGFYAVPKTRFLALGIGLSAFGAIIEVVQGLPFVGRDADVRDWIADTLAVIVVLLVLRIAHKALRID